MTAAAPMATVDTSPRAADDRPSTRRSRIALGVLVVAVAMALIDSTIVTVALPAIQDSLGTDEATFSWIVSGYALAYGLALIPAGRLGDRFGHARIFAIGVAGFTLASLWCGLAADSTELVIARMVQGLFGGVFFPSIAALLRLLFPGRSGDRAYAVLSATIGFSLAIGPILGGLLIEAIGGSDDWRWIFFVNVPLGSIAVLAGVALLPRIVEGSEATGMDPLGFALLSGSLIALLVPLIEGEQQGWPYWTFVSLAAGVLLLLLFALWEIAVARGGRSSPLVSPALFARASFRGGLILTIVYFAGITSIFFSISIFWQSGLGKGALESGLVSLPFALGSILGAALSERLVRRMGRGVLLLGSALVSLGLFGLWLVLVLVPSPDVGIAHVLGPLALAGVGSGLFISPSVQFVVGDVDRAEAGAAVGVVGTAQRVGSAAGVAIIGSVFFGALEIPTDRLPTPAVVADAFGISAAHAVLISSCFAAAALVLVFALPKRAATHEDHMSAA